MPCDHKVIRERHVILSFLFAAGLLMADPAPVTASAAGPTPAATAPVTPVAAATPAKKTEPPRLICKSESVTGSLMPKKTCYRSDELAQRKQDERENLERIQSQVDLIVH
jgi:3-oxoacyl-ACP reductase-like protein